MTRYQRFLRWLCEAEIIAHKHKKTKVVGNTSYFHCERCGKVLDCITTFSMRFTWEEEPITNSTHE